MTSRRPGTLGRRRFAGSGALSLLAAIGQVESGLLAGHSIDAGHRAVPPVLGPVLDGVSTAAISDTDGGRLDGNRRWDRAVGPMQFIPGTWAAFGVDADGDGRADPQDVYDAAAAGDYLCARGRDLALASGAQSAILAHNRSASYLSTVLAWQGRFAATGRGTLPTANGMVRTARGDWLSSMFLALSRPRARIGAHRPWPPCRPPAPTPLPPKPARRPAMRRSARPVAEVAGAEPTARWRQ